ncbi:MAG: DUF5011 domain-containing protein [Spirochaetales bacterium]|nr:DUF5011 domain-containing protein [Spirochaetales bacterium]
MKVHTQQRRKIDLLSVLIITSLSLFMLFGCVPGSPIPLIDTTLPIPGGSGVITVSVVETDSITLNWTPANDNETESSDLEYRIYYSTDSTDISSLTEAINNGTAANDWQKNISTLLVSGLTADTEYYFRIIIRDSNGNMDVYELFSHTTEALDTEQPVLSLIGESYIELLKGTSYSDLGATALDLIDGEITSQIIKTGEVDTNVPGRYLINYNVIDSAGNTARQKTRTVVVLPMDGVAPVITLNGPAYIDIAVGSTYTELEATAWDDFEGDVTSSIIIGGDIVTTTAENYFDITYTASDSKGNESVAYREVHVISEDDTAPEIILNGEETMSIIAGPVFTDPGATATDNIDGIITDNIVSSGLVSSDTIGTYAITYNVSDAAGNTAETITRTVNVIGSDSTPPEISLEGDYITRIPQFSLYNEPGAMAIDNLDGDISANIIITGEVDTNIIGSTIITYNLSDLAGNIAATVTRTVIVQLVDTTPPELDLYGDSTIYLPLNGNYEEEGARAQDDIDFRVIPIIRGEVDTSIAGTYYFTYDARDSAGNFAETLTRTVIVAPDGENHAPYAYAGEDVTSGPAWINLDGRECYDIDGNSLFYDWDVITSPEGPINNIRSSEISNYFFGEIGTYEIRLTLSDGETTSEDTVSFTIINADPEIDDIDYPETFNMDTGSTINIEITASDSNNDTIIYNCEFLSKPSGSSSALSDPTTTEPYFEPDVTGSYQLKITVSDGDLSTTEEISVEVYDDTNVEVEVNVQ